jgi:hypothetical protein
MLRSIRYFLSDVGHWLGEHRLVAALAVVLIAAAGAGAYVLASSDSKPEPAAPAPAPEVVVREVTAPEDSDDDEDEDETDDLGFPAFATKNTTRVAGADPVANAAAVALAVYPSTGGVAGPGAVTLVDAGDWTAGIAAASLMAEPVGAPVLLTDGEELPDLTADAIKALAPAGEPETDGRQAFAIGAASAPEGFDALELEGSNAAEVAAGIERLRARLVGDPEHIVIASSDDPEFAMPAAGWAARSGDPVLFAQRESLPAATAEALERYEDTPVYVLGPESVISAKTMKEIKDVASTAERVAGEDPVENAIEFARYASGSFGWNINDPGHGFVIANATRPLDAAAAAPLSASGTWGPLLVTEEAEPVPEELRGYLLDVKPGYEDDPTRAVYNHVWVIGDPGAVSVEFQAQVDELAEVAPVTSGAGTTPLGPPPGRPESQPDDDTQSDDDSGDQDDQP